jgi:hypothetical protein
MSTINSSKDVSKAIENVLTQLRDNNNFPNRQESDLCITQLKAAKNWLDQSNLEEALHRLRSGYKALAQVLLNNLLTQLNQQQTNIDNFLFSLTIFTMEMDAYSVPNYSEILKEVMKNLPSAQREYAKNYYKKMVDKRDETRKILERQSQKEIDPGIFNRSVKSLQDAADERTSKHHH